MEGDPWRDSDYVAFPKYSKSDYLSGPKLSDNCSLSDNALSFYHSFGYDCRRRNNLHVLEGETLAFVTGNLVHFLDSETGHLRCQRSAKGAGISCIEVHPTEPILAVAEQGSSPPIILFSWPDLEVVKVLRNGTRREFSCMAFSSCGTYLASQGGDPDHTLSIWNWREEKALVEVRAPNPFTHRVAFAPRDYRKFTTCGPGHLTFWTMHGSTRRRLVHHQGSFQLRELAEVAAAAVTADGSSKTVSATDWGNLLIWSNGEVYLEVTRKDGSNCHNGNVNQVVAEEGELITIGSDGWIRVWDSANIFNAKPVSTDDHECSFFRVDPMNEVEVESGAVLISIAKCKKTGDQNIWFIQDGSGSIWKVDLSFSLSMQKPIRVYRCHAASAKALAAGSSNSLLLSGGKDGKTCIYDLNRKILVNLVQYHAGVTCLKWLPIERDPSGMKVLIGYEDGVLRLFQIESDADRSGNFYRVTKALSVRFRLLLAQKPHTSAVRLLAISQLHAFVASLGEDSSVFFFLLDVREERRVRLVPCKRLELQQRPVAFCWRKSPDVAKAMLCFRDGCVWEMLLDNSFCPPSREDSSFALRSSTPAKCKKLHILKEEEEGGRVVVTHAQYLESRPGVVVAFAEANSSNGGKQVLVYQVDVDEEKNPERGRRGVVLPPYPEERNGEGTDIYITEVVFWSNDKFLFLGYSDGAIRVLRLHDNDRPDWILTNHLTLSVHDPRDGSVTAILPLELNGNDDQVLLATSGDDGGVVLFKLEEADFVEHPKEKRVLQQLQEVTIGTGVIQRMKWVDAALVAGRSEEQGRRVFPERRRHRVKVTVSDHVQDIEDPNQPSLEEEKRRSADEEKALGVEGNKLLIQRNLASMKVQFRSLQQRNTELPRQFQVSEDLFRMTDFTYEDIETETGRKLMVIRAANEEKTRESLEMLERIKKRFFDDVKFPRVVVRGIRTKQELCTFRISRCSNLDDLSYNQPASVALERQCKVDDASDGDDLPSDQEKEEDDLLLTVAGKFNAEEILSSFSETFTLKEPLNHKLLDDRILKALKKQDERKERKLARRKRWEELLSRKPKEGEEDTELENEIAQARANIGQYVRRTAEAFQDQHPITSGEQEQKLIHLMAKVRQEKEDFNSRVLEMRRKKLSLLEELEKIGNDLIEVQYNLEAERRKPVPTAPMLHPEELDADLFMISEKEVERIKSDLEKEAETMGLSGGGGGSGSRRSSMTSSVFKGSSSRLRCGSAGSQAQIRKAQQQLAATDRWSPPPLDEGMEEEEAEEDTRPTRTELESSDLVEIRYQYEQNRLIRKMERMIESFDEELAERVDLRKNVAVGLKYAELTMVLQYEELQVVKTTEGEDAELTQRVCELTATLDITDRKIMQHERRIKSIESDLGRYAERLNATHEAVASELVDNKHVERLTKLFHMRKKRNAKGATTLAGGVATAEDAVQGEEEGEEEEDQIQQVLPADVSPAALKFVEEMRRRRDVLEVCIRNEEKTLRKLKQVLHGLTSRRVHQEELLLEAKRDLHLFRLKTQAELNKIDVVFTLKLNQLPIAVTDRNFAQVTDQDDKPLVFAEDKWLALKKRTEELKAERATHKQKFKEDRQVYLNLQEKCQQIRGEIAVLTQQCSLEMEKRFGKGISFAVIESLALNRTLEEMKEGARRREEDRYKELAKKEECIKEEMRTKLTQSILRNTDLVDRKTSLTDELSQLKRKMVTLDDLAVKASRNKLKEPEEQLELKALQDLYHSQQLELHDMQQRIARFMTKGAPLIRTATQEGFGCVRDVRKRIASAKAKIRTNGQQQRSIPVKEFKQTPSPAIAVMVLRPDE